MRGISMLGFMPRLYDDELLYSWLARYHLYSGNAGPSQTMKELFGNERAIAVPDLPTNLFYLNEKVKHFTDGHAIHFLLNHTFYFYYSNFLDGLLKNGIQEIMLEGEVKGSLHMLTGMMASTIKENSCFRFCPICTDEDLNHLGETYWRLTHQLPGVYFCTKHSVLLQNSNQVFRPDNKHAFHAAISANCVPSPVQASFTSKTLEHLLVISKDLEFIGRNAIKVSVKELQDLYMSKLKEQGFASTKGKVDQQRLARQLECFYGTETLCVLQSEVNSFNDSCWLKAMTRKHRKTFHPIRHAILMRFLGICVWNISETSQVRSTPFGDGPFPCLNPAAEHFREKVISTVSITKGKNSYPIGHFKCSCGFHYTRNGPDRVPEDLFKINRKLELGSVWHAKLQQLVHVEKVSYRAASRILHVDINTVIKYSELHAPLPGKKNLAQEKKYSLKGSKQQVWLEVCNRDPRLTVTEIRANAPALYSWLYRNDKEWLIANSPKATVRRTSTVAKVDWSKRDAEIHNSIEVLLKIWDTSKNKRPTRLTVSSIGKFVGKKAILEKHLSKLPKCKRLLSEVCESLESYRVRRVRWAVEQLIDQGEQPAVWRIKRLAAAPYVSDQIIHSIVNQVIDQRSYRDDQDIPMAV